ncbi:MAG: hypothetical protein QMD09_14180, partial [Desulfatibacillaceae bacterium]|nr:hypothetical protein [Desulfatibacillaceae bacterium]
TWKALAAYFKGLKEPEVKQIGSRKIRFVPLIKGRLDNAGQASLANAVETDIDTGNKIPLEVLEHFLKGDALPPASQALGQAGQSRVVEDAQPFLPAAPSTAPSGQQPTASTNSPNEAISHLLPLVDSLPQDKREPARAFLQNLTPAEQEQAALLMDLSKTRADQLEEQLKLAANSIDELNIRLNNLQIEQTGLRRQLAGVEYEYSYLKQQLGNLPESLKAALAAEGILIPKDRGGSSQGFFGNIRKILSDGHAYMSVSRWHLIIILVLMLVFAALLLIKGLRLLKSPQKIAGPKANTYISRTLPPGQNDDANAQRRVNQQGFENQRAAYGKGPEEPTETISQKLDQIPTALGNKEPNDPSNLNADPNTSQALTKLEQEIAAIRQNHAEKIAPLLKDLNANIQNLNKAVAKAPPKQSQELKQILLALGASPKGSGQQEDTKALMEEINQKLDALKTQEILIQLDEIKKQTVEAIRESFDEIMNKVPDSQKAAPGQPDNAKSRQLSGMDIIRERLGYDR